ncbi:MAG: methyltransferase domain-containing protein [Pseudomonadota bacterium]
MKPEEVAQSYNQIADRWNGDQFQRSNGITQHERALTFATSQASGKRLALDIGCGCSGRFIDLLLSHNYVVEGLDLAEEMLKLAKQRHPTLTFHQADICTWQPQKSYDFITAWDSIWHIPLAEQISTMHKLIGALKPKGIMIFTTGGVDEPSDTTNNAMGVPMYHSAPGLSNLLAAIQKAGAHCRHLEYDQHPELHVYMIVQKS